MADLNREGMDTGKYLLSDIQTRLAVVEEKQKQAENDRNELKSEVKEMKVTMTTVDTKLDSIKDEFTLMKGKVGGAIWLLGSLFTALALVGDKMWKFLQTGNWN